MAEKSGVIKRPRALAAAGGRYLLLLAVCIAPLAIGTMHAVTLVTMAVLLALSVWLLWWDTPPIRARLAATVLFGAIVGLTGYTALQCLPLPARLLASLAPRNADVWSRVLAPLKQAPPTWVPLTLDPAATHVEVLRGVVYLLTFLAAMRVAHRREGAAVLSLAIIGTGVVLAAAALLHPAFEAHRVFGVYEPMSWSPPRHVSPLLNPNHLAAYLNVAFLLALGAITASEPPLPRPILGVALFFLGGTQVWVASRAGTLCLVVGVLLFAVLARAQRRANPDGRGVAAVAPAVVAVAAAGVLVLGVTEDPQRELFTGDVSKFLVLRDVATLLKRHGLFGIGRGAFASAFPAFRTGTGYAIATHPENLMAQWASEWGVPVTLLAAAALIFALRPRVALARHRIALGAWCALAALAVHNMADFNSEVPGVVIAATACAATVVGGSAGMDARWKMARWSRRPRLVAGVSLAVAALGLALASPSVGHELIEEKNAARRAALGEGESLSDMHAFARAAMLRHPAEAYIPLTVGIRASERRDENPLPWLGAALERAPVNGPAHFLVARAISGRAPSQARLEYRVAVEQAPELLDAVAKDAERLVRSFDDAMQVVPIGREGVPVLEALARGTSLRLPATSTRLDSEQLTRDSTSVWPAMRRAHARVDDLESMATWCDGSSWGSCVRAALEAAVQAERLAPLQCEPYVLEARTRLTVEAAEPALEELLAQAGAVTDRVPCLEDVVVLAGTRAPKLVETALDQIANADCVNEKDCLENLAFVAQSLEARGMSNKALSIYKRAFDRSPDDDVLLERMAQLASALGRHAEAALNYAAMARRHPSDPRWQNAEDIERRAATGKPGTL